MKHRFHQGPYDPTTATTGTPQLKAIGLILVLSALRARATKTRCTEEVDKRRRDFLSLSALGYGS